MIVSYLCAQLAVLHTVYLYQYYRLGQNLHMINKYAVRSRYHSINYNLVVLHTLGCPCAYLDSFKYIHYKQNYRAAYDPGMGGGLIKILRAKRAEIFQNPFFIKFKGQKVSILSLFTLLIFSGLGGRLHPNFKEYTYTLFFFFYLSFLLLIISLILSIYR